MRGAVLAGPWWIAVSAASSWSGPEQRWRKTDPSTSSTTRSVGRAARGVRCGPGDGWRGTDLRPQGPRLRTRPHAPAGGQFRQASPQRAGHLRRSAVGGRNQGQAAVPVPPRSAPRSRMCTCPPGPPRDGGSAKSMAMRRSVCPFGAVRRRVSTGSPVAAYRRRGAHPALSRARQPVEFHEGSRDEAESRVHLAGASVRRTAERGDALPRKPRSHPPRGPAWERRSAGAARGCGSTRRASSRPGAAAP